MIIQIDNLTEAQQIAIEDMMARKLDLA